MGPPLKLFKNQKYQELKQECIKDGRLFCDTTFLPENDSLFYNRLLPGKVVWKRPQVFSVAHYLLLDPFHSNFSWNFSSEHNLFPIWIKQFEKNFKMEFHRFMSPSLA